MPVVEPVVTEEKLRLLLAEQHESSLLDYKSSLSLSDTRQLVELAKDVGAMQIDGGYIVIGADDTGGLTGGLSAEDAALLDEATLRPKLARYLPEPFEVRSAVHTIEEQLVGVIYVAPSPSGLCIFRAGGNYPGGSAFRAGDVWARHGSSSEPWQQTDVERVLKRLVAQAKEEWRRELADDLARSFSGPAQELTTAPAASLTWQLDAETFVNVVVEQLRRGDDIPLRLLLDRMPRDVRELLTLERADDLTTFLERMTCLAALSLRLDLTDVFARVLHTLVRIYDIPFDEHGNPRQDLEVKPAAFWLKIIRHVYSLGALAVRLEAWDRVKELVMQRPRGLVRGEYYSNWLRHALTMASRSGELEEREDGRVQTLSLLSLAHQTAAALGCVSDDVVSDDELLDSLIQFDVYFNVTALCGAESPSGADYYPNFSRFYSHRSDPALRALIENQDARAALFPLDDEALAATIRLVLDTARQESFRYSGWHGVQDDVVRQFLAEHDAP